MGRAKKEKTSGLEALTFTEKKVLGLLCTGRSNMEIGQSLGITTRTVKTHLFRIYLKLKVESRTQAVLYVFRGDAPRREVWP